MPLRRWLGWSGVVRKWLTVAAIFMGVQPLVLVLGIVIHEGAHAVAVIAFGGQVDSIAVLPGLQIYPHFERVEWQYWVAQVTHGYPGSQFEVGVIAMSGSVANAAAAYLALAFLYLRTTGMLVRIFLLNAVFVLGLDVVTYTLLPPIGLRHWVFVGGADSETLFAARLLGIPLPLFVAAVMIQGAVILWFGGVALLRFFREFGLLTQRTTAIGSDG